MLTPREKCRVSEFQTKKKKSFVTNEKVNIFSVNFLKNTTKTSLPLNLNGKLTETHSKHEFNFQKN